MQLYVKIGSYEKMKINEHGWIFKEQVNTALPEFKELKIAITEVEKACFSCSFKVYDIGTHYFIETKLPDGSTYKNAYWKHLESTELSKRIEQDIRAEWLDKIFS